MTARVVCAGIAVLDRVYEMGAMPAAPGKYIAHDFRETGGGMAATAAVAIAALGGTAAWCGRLGADPAGRTLLDAFARHGVDTSHVTVAPDGHTPTSAVIVEPEGERMLACFTGAGLPEDAAIDPGLLAGAGSVLGDPRWLSGSERLFMLAAERGLKRVLDADANATGILRRLAPLADHVVFSQRGLAEFAGTDDAEAGLARVAPDLPGITAVTLGPAGSLWWEQGRITHVPAPRVAARDTTGCGDVFHGAYALALAEGAAVPDAARFATAAAAIKAARGDGWDGMPDRTAVMDLLSEAWTA